MKKLSHPHIGSLPVFVCSVLEAARSSCSCRGHYQWVMQQSVARPHCVQCACSKWSRRSARSTWSWNTRAAAVRAHCSDAPVHSASPTESRVREPRGTGSDRIGARHIMRPNPRLTARSSLLTRQHFLLSLFAVRAQSSSTTWWRTAAWRRRRRAPNSARSALRSAVLPAPPPHPHWSALPRTFVFWAEPSLLATCHLPFSSFYCPHDETGVRLRLRHRLRHTSCPNQRIAPTALHLLIVSFDEISSQTDLA